MILNCVVIDDDPEALNQITSHIKRTPTLQLIGAYTSAREAVRDVRNTDMSTCSTSPYRCPN